jgi:hypothetical protein
MARSLAVVAGVLLAPGAAAAQRWSLEVEGGSEYDSNVHRLEVPEEDRDLVEAAPLLRFGARLRGSTKPHKRHLFGYSLFGASKVFLEDGADDENVLILAGNARYDVGLTSRRAVMRIAGSFYEAIGDDDVPTSRNFSTADARGEVVLVGPGQHRVTTHAGLRRFRYKPDAQFDWSGDHYGARYSTTLWSSDSEGGADASSFDVAASYRFERRQYDGVAFANSCGPGDEIVPDCFYPTGIGRSDVNHGASAEVSYTGDRIYGLRYELQVNDSNSVGQSLVRHRVEASVTSELFADVFLTAKGTVQFNVFLDPLLLARDVNAQSFVSIDDENRNGLALHATRTLGAKWTAEARYGFFTNEFATRELTFRRQTAYLGLVYRYGR